MANEKNLIPLNKRTKKEQREIARNGGKKSGEVRREKKKLSEFYTDIIAKRFDMEGEKSLDAIISRILERGDSATVSFLKEIREATEGNKLEVSGDMKIVYLDKQDADL